MTETFRKPELWPDEQPTRFSDYSKASFIFCLGMSGLDLNQVSTIVLSSTLIFFFFIMHR